MLSFKLIYSDGYYLPIGQHVFPAEKYRRVHQQLIESGTADASDFLTPQPASDQDILLVHTPQYVSKLKTGTLSAREELQLEVPFKLQFFPDRKSTRLNSSHVRISYAVFCLKKKT